MLDAAQEFLAGPFKEQAFLNNWDDTAENRVRVRVLAAALWAVGALAVWGAFHTLRSVTTWLVRRNPLPLAEEIDAPGRPGWRARAGQLVTWGAWFTILTAVGYASVYAVSILCGWFPPTKTVPLVGGDDSIVVTFVRVQTATGGLWVGSTEVTEAVYGWSVGEPVPAGRAALPLREKNLDDYKQLFRKVGLPCGAVGYDATGRLVNRGGVRLPTPGELAALYQNLPTDTAGVERHGWVKGNSGGAVNPVAQKPAHWGKYVGVHDLFGNVQEIGVEPDDQGYDRTWVIGGMWYETVLGKSNLISQIDPTWYAVDAVGARMVASAPDWQPDRFSLSKVIHAAGWARAAWWLLAGLAVLVAGGVWARATDFGWGVVARSAAVVLVVAGLAAAVWGVAEYLW